MARPQFIFGGDTGVSSPEELKRLRAIAEALGGPYAPSNISEGLSAIGAALGGRIADSRANKIASAGEESRLAAMSPITGALYGGFPEAPKETVAQALSGDTPSAVPAGERASYIREGMVKRGLPSHVADAFLMNFQDESGLDPGINEKAPLVPGSRGGFGLYQVTGPRRRAYEAFANERDAPLDDVDAQLDFLMTELQGPEARAAKSILSAGNTGEAAAAIVNDFLRPAEQHRSSRERRYLRNTAAPSAASAVNAMAQGQPMPQQVASLDPSAGMGVTPPPAVPSQDAPQVNPTLMAQAPMAGTPMPLVGAQSPTGGPTPAAGGPQQAMAQPAPAMPQQPPQARMEMSGQSDRLSQAHLIPQIMQALQNPWLQDGDRAFLAAQLQQIQQENSPETLMAREKARLELEEARRGPKPIEVNGRLVDPRTGQVVADFSTPSTATVGDAVIDTRTGQPIYQGQPKPTDDMREYQHYAEFEQSQGRQPLGPLEWDVARRKAGATNISNVNGGETNKFYETLDTENAKIFSALSEAGVQGHSKMAQIDRLAGLLDAAPQGAAAMLKQAAGEYGINTEGLSDIQAAQALINELVPQQRQPGSGPMSDADLALFKQSLPRLINQPGGNQMIIDTMRGITAYQIQMGQIADAVADRTMTPAQARDAIRNLPNPLSMYSRESSGDAPPPPPGIDAGDWQYMTPEERRAFQ